MNTFNHDSIPHFKINPLVDLPGNRAGTSDTSVPLDDIDDSDDGEGIFSGVKERNPKFQDKYFGYFFQGTWYRILRESFLVSSYARIHRAGFRSQFGVYQERSRHLTSFPYIIHPYSNFRCMWEVLITIALKFTLVRQPILLAYLSDHRSESEFSLSTFLSVCFLMDIVLNFRTGIVSIQSDTITLDPILIAKSYVRSWFLVDVISTIPYDSILHILISKARMNMADLQFFEYLRLLELLKIFRLSRVIRYITRFQEAFVINSLYIRVINLLVVIFFTLHWLACIHYMVADLMNPIGHRSDLSWISQMNLWDKSVGFRYINSVIRALSNMAGLGYGLECPREPEDIICTIVSILIGATFFALIVGNLSSILINMDVAQKKYAEVLNQVLEYMRFKQVPKELQNRVIRYYEQRYRRNFFNEHVILANVSNVIREELQMFNCRSLVEEVPLFQGLPHGILQGLVARLKFEVYLPQDIIISANTLGDSMYFIEHGAVSVMAPSGRVVAHLRDGDFFGELALITNERRNATVVATNSCDVYRLERADFEDVVVNYPEIYAQLIKLAEERAQQLSNKDPTSKLKDMYKRKDPALNEQNIDELSKTMKAKIMDTINLGKKTKAAIKEDVNKYFLSNFEICSAENLKLQ